MTITPTSMTTEPGPEYSERFLVARQRGWDAWEARNALLRRKHEGDESVTAEDIAEAERAALALSDEALAVLDDDRSKALERHKRNQESAALNAPLNHAVETAVRILTDRGPMTASELEALRIRGLSKNLVRPVLREAEQRGLVRRQQLGRRVVWSAI